MLEPFEKARYVLPTNQKASPPNFVTSSYFLQLTDVTLSVHVYQMPQYVKTYYNLYCKLIQSTSDLARQNLPQRLFFIIFVTVYSLYVDFILSS